MKTSLLAGFMLVLWHSASSQLCTPAGDQVTYGTGNLWIGYVYDNLNFTNYAGFVNEGVIGNPNFDESFGGDYTNYNTSGCPVYTETFSVRYKLNKTFAPGDYQFIVGADDGYRLSLDGGVTWVINQWNDQSYTTSAAVVNISGSVSLVLEYYENGGGNRISFNVQPVCIGTSDQTIYGITDTWKCYIYDGTNFDVYKGMVTKGWPGNAIFDEDFGGSNTTFSTGECSTQTETFSARYRLHKYFAPNNYLFTVGGDDGYRLSVDGGAHWIIDSWRDQGYSLTSYLATLSGYYDLVIEYYENGGDNRLSFAYSSLVLPVKLTKFEGKVSSKTVHLNWVTADESNINNYTIERSSNGTDFTMIGKVSALNGSGNAYYDFIDHSPLQGNNYYRLCIMDRDTKIVFSPIIKIVFSGIIANILFPTLVTGEEVILKAGSNYRGSIATLYDLSGKKLQQIVLPAIIYSNENVPIKLNRSLLTSATYLLVVRAGEELIARQLLVVQ